MQPTCTQFFSAVIQKVKRPRLPGQHLFYTSRASRPQGVLLSPALNGIPGDLQDASQSAQSTVPFSPSKFLLFLFNVEGLRVLLVLLFLLFLLFLFNVELWVLIVLFNVWGLRVLLVILCLFNVGWLWMHLVQTGDPDLLLRKNLFFNHQQLLDVCGE
ncbi:hypothetical protein EYF80_055387 [Liparis tanakae]|uniref:Transmembrane protein n=1 Tax=Liparis tanakae TaxID=230148 RepID=A0A4Z2F0P9_9TELE|nr:hypothetical protein EYF80_055387 [Liparis tanakae]